MYWTDFEFLCMFQSPLGLPLTMEEKEDNLSDQEPDQEAVQRYTTLSYHSFWDLDYFTIIDW